MATGICPFCGKKVDKFIMFRGDVVGCRYCGIHVKQTNADRIRAMSDEELAEFIASGVPKDVCKDRCGGDESFQCSECVLDWLREEARTND